MNADFLWPTVIAAFSAALVAVLGALATDLGPWYRALKQPSYKPADWAFGPAWTLIFALTATAGVLAWMQTNTPASKAILIGVFALNGVLNVLWTVIYFKLKRPDWAFYEVTLLWLSVVVMIVVVWPLSHTASLLLWPYLMWIAFAASLNWATVKLNAPFK